MTRPLNFIDHKTRKPLTAQEVNYWKLNLSRILKVGAEFEFNLPDKPTGTCKGKSFACPCINYGKEDKNCWTVCLREKECASTPHISRCNNFKTDKCSETKCLTCKEYSFACHGLLCSNNIPACVACEDFILNCEECEYRFDPNKNPDSIRASCTSQFSPSGSYGVISHTGVHNVVTDGSLLGKKGMEVITAGRRVDYWEFFNMAKNIIDTSVKKGAYINERCSIHMHVLAAYYSNITETGNNRSSSKVSELERSVPEIILANLHQLIRRYQNAITWMSTGLDNPDKLTRWEKFRVSILGISAIANNMRDVKSQVEAAGNGTKYGWINYKFCSFDGNGDLNRLHVEFRTMDGLLSPSASAAFACLYYALFIKAIELSKYGVMEVGDKIWKKQAFTVKDALMNNCADWQEGNKHGRFSDTTKLHKYTDILVSESFELISQLKHILASIGPAYDVLEKLAESPCSIRRCAGTDWTEIEKDLSVELTDEGKFEYEISKIIDTRAIIGMSDKQSWMQGVAKILQGNVALEISQESKEKISDKVAIHVEEQQSNGEMIWANKIGTMIRV